MITVPSPEDMDDETFLKHIDKRHHLDLARGHAGNNVIFPRSTWRAWVPLYRTWHDRLHAQAAPGEYDHEHLEPSWMEDME